MVDHKRENDRRDQVYGPVLRGTNPLKANDAQLDRWGLLGKSREEVLDLGDLHPGHRYML